MTDPDIIVAPGHRLHALVGASLLAALWLSACTGYLRPEHPDEDWKECAHHAFSAEQDAVLHAAADSMLDQGYVLTRVFRPGTDTREVAVSGIRDDKPTGTYVEAIVRITPSGPGTCDVRVGRWTRVPASVADTGAFGPPPGGRFVTDPAPVTELVEAARRRLAAGPATPSPAEK